MQNYDQLLDTLASSSAPQDELQRLIGLPQELAPQPPPIPQTQEFSSQKTAITLSFTLLAHTLETLRAQLLKTFNELRPQPGLLSENNPPDLAQTRERLRNLANALELADCFLHSEPSQPLEEWQIHARSRALTRLKTQIILKTLQRCHHLFVPPQAASVLNALVAGGKTLELSLAQQANILPGPNAQTAHAPKGKPLLPLASLLTHLALHNLSQEFPKSSPGLSEQLAKSLKTARQLLAKLQAPETQPTTTLNHTLKEAANFLSHPLAVDLPVQEEELGASQTFWQEHERRTTSMLALLMRTTFSSPKITQLLEQLTKAAPLAPDPRDDFAIEDSALSELFEAWNSLEHLRSTPREQQPPILRVFDALRRQCPELGKATTVLLAYKLAINPQALEKILTQEISLAESFPEVQDARELEHNALCHAIRLKTDCDEDVHEELRQLTAVAVNIRNAERILSHPRMSALLDHDRFMRCAARAERILAGQPPQDPEEHQIQAILTHAAALKDEINAHINVSQTVLNSLPHILRQIQCAHNSRHALWEILTLTVEHYPELETLAQDAQDPCAQTAATLLELVNSVTAQTGEILPQQLEELHASVLTQANTSLRGLAVSLKEGYTLQGTPLQLNELCLKLSFPPLLSAPAALSACAIGQLLEQSARDPRSLALLDSAQLSCLWDHLPEGDPRKTEIRNLLATRWSDKMAKHLRTLNALDTIEPGALNPAAIAAHLCRLPRNIRQSSQPMIVHTLKTLLSSPPWEAHCAGTAQPAMTAFTQSLALARAGASSHPLIPILAQIKKEILNVHNTVPPGIVRNETFRALWANADNPLTALYENALNHVLSLDADQESLRTHAIECLRAAALLSSLTVSNKAEHPEILAATLEIHAKNLSTLHTYLVELTSCPSTLAQAALCCQQNTNTHQAPSLWMESLENEIRKSQERCTQLERDLQDMDKTYNAQRTQAQIAADPDIAQQWEHPALKKAFRKHIARKQHTLHCELLRARGLNQLKNLTRDFCEHTPQAHEISSFADALTYALATRTQTITPPYPPPNTLELLDAQVLTEHLEHAKSLLVHATRLLAQSSSLNARLCQELDNGQHPLSLCQELKSALFDTLQNSPAVAPGQTRQSFAELKRWLLTSQPELKAKHQNARQSLQKIAHAIRTQLDAINTPASPALPAPKIPTAPDPAPLPSLH